MIRQVRGLPQPCAACCMRRRHRGLCRNRRRNSRARNRHTTPGQSRARRCRIQIFAKRLPHKVPGGVVVALAVKLACTGSRVPGFEIFGNRLVQQGELVVDVRWRTWAVSAGNGCLAILFFIFSMLGLSAASGKANQSGIDSCLEKQALDTPKPMATRQIFI